MKKIGIAFGGGGARGMAHIVYIKALEELGLKASVVSGTSIGAIMGAFYCAGLSSQDMEELVDSLNFFKIGKMFDFTFFRNTGLFKGDKVVEFLENLLPAKTFEELEIPLKVVASDFWEREEVVIDEGELVKAVRASMSIPGVFEPVIEQGRVLIDGGLANPVPYNIIRKECDLLIAVDVIGRRMPQSTNHLMPSTMQSALEAADIAQTTIVKRLMDSVKPNIYVRPDLINVEIMDFHRLKEILEAAQKEKEPFKRLVDKAMKRILPFYNC
jgi:NTE family protein